MQKLRPVPGMSDNEARRLSKSARLYARRDAAGLCKKCGEPADGFKRCGKCRAKRAKWFKERRERQAAKGICRLCLSRPRERGKSHCAECRQGAKAARERLRDEVFAAYGGPCCNECGEPRRECLQVDHVNNDGAAHRREIGRSAYKLYVWLKRNGFPEGFQILCASCNAIKNVLGFVPPVKEHRRTGRHVESA